MGHRSKTTPCSHPYCFLQEEKSRNCSRSFVSLMQNGRARRPLPFETGAIIAVLVRIPPCQRQLHETIRNVRNVRKVCNLCEKMSAKDVCRLFRKGGYFRISVLSAGEEKLSQARRRTGEKERTLLQKGKRARRLTCALLREKGRYPPRKC